MFIGIFHESEPFSSLKYSRNWPERETHDCPMELHLQFGGDTPRTVSELTPPEDILKVQKKNN